MFKVEKNVKIAPRPGNRSTMWECKYPFNSMEIKDSFFVPAETKKEQNIVRSNVYYERQQYVRRTGIKTKITTRLVKESDKIGIRVWRVK